MLVNIVVIPFSSIEPVPTGTYDSSSSSTSLAYIVTLPSVRFRPSSASVTCTSSVTLPAVLFVTTGVVVLGRLRISVVVVSLLGEYISFPRYFASNSLSLPTGISSNVVMFSPFSSVLTVIFVPFGNVMLTSPYAIGLPVSSSTTVTFTVTFSSVLFNTSIVVVVGLVVMSSVVVPLLMLYLALPS